MTDDQASELTRLLAVAVGVGSEFSETERDVLVTIGQGLFWNQPFDERARALASDIKADFAAQCTPTDPVHQDDGWWFWDEVWAYRYGPYQTEAEARDALDSYAAEVLEDKPVARHRALVSGSL